MEFAAWTHVYGGHFPAAVFAWPGQSFFIGLFDPVVSPVIKLLNFGHAATWAGALALSVSAARRNPRDSLAVLSASELAVNGLFVLTMGGPFGFTMFYRYLATQANAFVVLAWVRHTNLKPAFWWVAGLTSLAMASSMARRS